LCLARGLRNSFSLLPHYVFAVPRAVGVSPTDADFKQRSERRSSNHSETFAFRRRKRTIDKIPPAPEFAGGLRIVLIQANGGTSTGNSTRMKNFAKA